MHPVWSDECPYDMLHQVRSQPARIPRRGLEVVELHLRVGMGRHIRLMEGPQELGEVPRAQSRRVARAAVAKGQYKLECRFQLREGGSRQREGQRGKRGTHEVQAFEWEDTCNIDEYFADFLLALNIKWVHNVPCARVIVQRPGGRKG